MSMTSASETIIQEITIKAPAKRIFDALTDSGLNGLRGGVHKDASRPRTSSPICGPAASG